MMSSADETEIYCSRCHGKDFVRNGRVRGQQRFRCNGCNSNFVNDPKHRWPPSSKLINIVLFNEDEPTSDPTEKARLERWLLEAKEHHPWFVRALAEAAISGYTMFEGDIEQCIIFAWDTYHAVTKRHPENYYDSFAPLLYGDMCILGTNELRNDLLEWLEAHSSDASNAHD